MQDITEMDQLQYCA